MRRESSRAPDHCGQCGLLVVVLVGREKFSGEYWPMKSDLDIRQERDAHRRAARLLSKQLNKRRKIARGEPVKKQPRSYKKDGHEYLMTAVEKAKRRMEIFRAAGGEVVWFDESDPDTIEEIRPATCQGCVEPHLIGWDNSDGQWHHNCELRKKCDSVACALYVCPSFHVRYHGRVIQLRNLSA